MQNPIDKYEIVIGLEVHVQLKTKSKAFCSDSTTFGAEPNTQISPISLGHPGTLPKANIQQIKSAVKLGLALGCTINRHNRFDRKNYFYADLPKGYQITQDEHPICLGGGLNIPVNGKKKFIALTRIHMEEDAGKSIHDIDPKHSMIDLNRAGVPLLEVVTEPDLRSADEAHAFLNEMRKIVRYLDVSDGNMEEGSLRCDCNVSVRLKGEQTYGTRCEIKNVNSMRNAKRAITYEANRQIKLLEAGQSVDQETRSFDAAKGHTNNVLRTKEDAHDYRYFPDPDLPGIELSESFIEAIKSTIPELPEAVEQNLIAKYGLGLKDASIIAEDRMLTSYFKEMVEAIDKAKPSANWLVNTVRAYLNEQGISIVQFPVRANSMAELVDLVDTKKVTKLLATKQLFPALIASPGESVQAIATRLNLFQEADDDNLSNYIQMALEKYPDKVEAYRRGKKGVLGLFMGEVMKISRGKADPNLANKLLREKLES
ncbi:MAG: Asp-tRNA(Asn)/Glu-tRNA(Gln) amidotransferase subunit GatB [Bacteroidota bacterium]